MITALTEIPQADTAAPAPRTKEKGTKNARINNLIRQQICIRCGTKKVEDVEKTNQHCESCHEKKNTSSHMSKARKLKRVSDEIVREPFSHGSICLTTVYR